MAALYSNPAVKCVSILENGRNWVSTIVATNYYSQGLYFCHNVGMRGNWGSSVESMLRCRKIMGVDENVVKEGEKYKKSDG
jgi:hypothetical protein